MLTRDLLEELAERLRAQHVPAIDCAQPGLSDAEMKDLVAPLSISLPGEARTWWGWHDGVLPAAGPAATEIGPGRKWLQLRDAVAECVQIRAMIHDVSQTDPRPEAVLWSPTWLPLVHADGLYVIDTRVPDDAPCPVRVHWFYEPETENDLRSMEELVTLWIKAIDRGAWQYDQQADHWVVDHAILESWPAAKRGIV